MSGYHAVDALGESFERTMKLFTPLNFDLWAKLALVAMLAGLLWSTNTSVNVGSPQGENISTSVLVAVAAGLFALMLGVMFLSATSTFVFVKALATSQLRLAEYYKDQTANGLRLFAVWIIAVVVMVGCIFGIILTVMPSFTGGPEPQFNLTAFLAIFLAIIAMAFVYISWIWVIVDFIVPIMYAKKTGFIGAFMHLAHLIEAEFLQFAVYTAIRIVFAIAGLIIYAIFFYPLMFVAMMGMVMLMLVSGGESFAGMMLMLAIMVPAMLCILYVVSFITMPVSAFIRYYSMVFLEKADPTLKIFD